MERYAVYLAPRAASALHRFGASWLGWDAESAAPAERRVVSEGDGPAIDLDAITAAPRRYGFHGTLKPPFRLAEGYGEQDLLDAVAGLAATLPPVSLNGLHLRQLGSFLALIPDPDDPGVAGLRALAAACVTGLDRFRAPPSAEELERRRAKGLTPAQEVLLERWGYPYVLDEFRYHMTLTGPVRDPDTVTGVRDILTPVTRPFAGQTIVFDEVCVFGDPGKSMNFRILSRIPLSGH